MSAQKTLYMAMIEEDLQQAWELLEQGAYDLAKHHLTEAAGKVDELKQAESTIDIPTAEQKTLL